MKKPADEFFISKPFSAPLDRYEIPEEDKGNLSKSDLHDDNLNMMTEIYGGNFQETWKKSHKNWWL